LIGDIVFAVVEEKFSIYYIVKHLFMVSVVEWRGPIDHLEDKDTECPPICHEGLPFVSDDLRTYIRNLLLT
jgi:hypothetical protein